MPRYPPPFLCVIWSTRLLSRQLCSFRLPPWSPRCGASTTITTLQLLPMPGAQDAANCCSWSCGALCKDPRGGEVSTLPLLKFPSTSFWCHLERCSFPSQSHPFPRLYWTVAPPSATMLTLGTRAAVTSGFLFNQEPEGGRRSPLYLSHSRLFQTLMTSSCPMTSSCLACAWGWGNLLLCTVPVWLPGNVTLSLACLPYRKSSLYCSASGLLRGGVGQGRVTEEN